MVLREKTALCFREVDDRYAQVCGDDWSGFAGGKEQLREQKPRLFLRFLTSNTLLYQRHTFELQWACWCFVVARDVGIMSVRPICCRWSFAQRLAAVAGQTLETVPRQIFARPTII